MAKAIKITGDFNAIPDGFPAIKAKFNDYTWAEIKQISDAELWNLYGFEVGDVKQVAVNGYGTFGCYITDFNHNWKLEGKGISFSLGINSHNLNVTIGNIQSLDSAWKSSSMRSQSSSFISKLPKDLQAVIKEVTKYSSSNGLNDMATKDKIFPPSEFEITGFNTYGDNARPFQTQYAYYQGGNSIFKYDYNESDTGGRGRTWNLRTKPQSKEGMGMYWDNSSNRYISKPLSGSYGFVPCFVV